MHHSKLYLADYCKFVIVFFIHVFVSKFQADDIIANFFLWQTELNSYDLNEKET